MAIIHFLWHLIILLKCIVFQANSLITNEEIEKASAAGRVRQPRAIPDPLHIPQAYYRRYNKYTGRYEYQRYQRYQPWRTTTRKPWVWTTRQNIFKGKRPLTPKRIHFTRRPWRPKKNGSIFEGITRKDWDRKYNKPTVDPFGNRVTPRWMFYEWLKNRSSVFKTLEELKPSSVAIFAKKIRQKFVDRYIKPTPFAVFWTKSQLENPTIATLRPIPESALYFAPLSLRKALAPNKSFHRIKSKPLEPSKSLSSSMTSLSDITFDSSSVKSTTSMDGDVSSSFWGSTPSKSSSEVSTEISSSAFLARRRSDPSDIYATHLSLSYTVTEAPTKSPLELLYPDI